MDGLKYFMCLISQGNSIPYIDTDIRKIIWNYARETYIILKIRDSISMKLSLINNGIKVLPI